MRVKVEMRVKMIMGVRHTQTASSTDRHSQSHGHRHSYGQTDRQTGRERVNVMYSRFILRPVRFLLQIRAQSPASRALPPAD